MSDKSIYLKKFGLHIKKLREAKGLTQFQVSSDMNKDRQSLQRIETGRTNPTIYYLKELALALDIKLKELTDFKY